MILVRQFRPLGTRAFPKPWLSTIPPLLRHESVSFKSKFQKPNCHFLRFQSTISSETRSKTLQTPKKTPVNDFRKLLRLARPEFKHLVLALLCLIATSTVSMAVPLCIGKIIDTAKEKEAADHLKPADEVNGVNGADGVNTDTTASPGFFASTFSPTASVEIFGLPQSQFYAGLGGLFLVAAFTNFGRVYLLRSVGERLVARLRSRLFSRVLSQDSYFFDTGMKTGDLISRISNDTQVISRTLSGNISDGARSAISGVVGLSMMFWVSWKLTVCMSLIFPPLILMSTVYGRRIKQLSRTIQENLGDLTKVTEEKLNGLKTIQSFAQQTPVVHEYNKEIKKIFNTSMHEAKLSGIYFGNNQFMGNITIIGLLIVGTNLIGHGEITVGDLSSFMMYAIYTGLSIFGLGNFYTELMKGIGAAERVFELLESRPRITTTLGKKVNDLTSGDIQLHNIGFHYPSRPNSAVFNNLNVTVKNGEHVCLVGPSGSGKSTVGQLLLRFYDPIEGKVLVNGHDIAGLNLNFYRSKIGYVSQEPLLFSGTLRENIIFGIDRRVPVSDEEIEQACRLANAWDFIEAFPNKLETVIGPSSSGAQLSGGQRQRISLARTLIKKPKILILDEATSALDSHLEEVVMRNLSLWLQNGDVTILSIAHRLSTIKNSERIIVFDGKGDVVEDGKFKELYADDNSELNKLLQKTM